MLWQPISSPPSRVTTRAGPFSRMADTSRAVSISAPSRCACAVARRARSAPLSPVGEAEVVLDPRALPGLPAGRVALHHQRPQPLRRAVDRGGQPGRAATEDHEVVEGKLRRRCAGRSARRSRSGRAAPEPRRPRTRAPAGGPRPGRAAAISAARLGVGDVEPAVGDAVAGEEVAGGVRLGREAVAHQAQARLGAARRGVGLPVLQEVVEHRVEPLLRRVPGLHQVVVEAELVDRADGGLGVGVGREQHALGLRGHLQGAREELDPAHPGHALVGDQERHGLARGARSARRRPPRPRRSPPAPPGTASRSGAEGRARSRGRPRDRRRRPG